MNHAAKKDLEVRLLRIANGDLARRLDAALRTTEALREALEASAVIFRAIEGPSPAGDAEADRQADRIGEVLKQVEAALAAGTETPK